MMTSENPLADMLACISVQFDVMANAIEKDIKPIPQNLRWQAQNIRVLLHKNGYTINDSAT